MKAPPTSAIYLQCRLPVELMYIIIDLLTDNPSALSKLLFLHRLFHPTLEPMLYTKRTQFKSRTSHVAFLDTLASNPHLAAYTTHYDLRPTTEFGGWQDDDIEKVTAAITNMVNLKHFHVDMWMYNPFDPEELFKALKHTKLESFEWSTWCRKQEIVDLLRTQPNIKKIKTQFVDAPQKPLEPTACPNLWYVDGDRAVLEAVMPGRNVEVLVWTPLMYEGFRPVSTQLQPAIDKLRALAFDGKRLKAIPIFLINGLGRRLEVLQLTFENTFKRVFLETIEHMKRLQTLIIVCSKEQHQAVLRAHLFPIARACPSLVSIYTCISTTQATPIPPEMPNEHWRIKWVNKEEAQPAAGSETASVELPVIESIQLQGIEHGDIFHRIVEEMYQSKKPK